MATLSLFTLYHEYCILLSYIIAEAKLFNISGIKYLPN